jgi:predicted permease
MLLVGAGLFVKSLRNAQHVDLGYDADRILTVNVELRGAAAPEGGRAELYRRFAERLRAVPGVSHATTTMAIPFSMSGSTDLDVPGVDSIGRFGQILLNGVGADYFETVGTRILRGRALGPEDRKGSPLVMVVSDSMARALWPRQEAVGKCVKVGGRDRPCSTVVGVAQNVAQDDVRGERYLQYWFPESQNQGDNGGAFAALARVSGDAEAMAVSIRAALQPSVPGNAYLDVRPLSLAVDRVVRPWRMGATMFGVFGVLGLAIAAMGLYSLLAYAVSQRAQELSVRIALGARAGDVLRLVMSQGLRVTLIGIAAGLAGALVASRWVRELLFGVQATDPVVLTSVVGTLLLAALIASLLPAWRAAAVDPSKALRVE